MPRIRISTFILSEVGSGSPRPDPQHCFLDRKVEDQNGQYFLRQQLPKHSLFKHFILNDFFKIQFRIWFHIFSFAIIRGGIRISEAGSAASQLMRQKSIHKKRDREWDIQWKGRGRTADYEIEKYIREDIELGI